MAAEALGGAEADLAVVFASGAHLAAPEATLEGVHDAIAPQALVGCGAGGVLGGRPRARIRHRGRGLGGRVRQRQRVSPSTPRCGRRRRPRARGPARSRSRRGADHALPTRTRSRPTAVLAGLAAAVPGRAGARRPVERAHGRRRRRAVPRRRRVARRAPSASACDGVELLPCVSQGAAPLGPRGDDHRRRGQRDPRARRPAGARDGRARSSPSCRPASGADRRRTADRDRDRRRQARVRAGRLPRPRCARRRPRHRCDRRRSGRRRRARSSGCTRATRARPTRTCGARCACASQAMPATSRAGALVFSCNGRGRGDVRHRATTTPRWSTSELGGAPAAGFFAAGEIGPVGGRSFLHGFTATVARVPGLGAGPRAGSGPYDCDRRGADASRWRTHRAGDRRHRRHRPRDRARVRRPRREPDPHRAPRGRARRARASELGRGRSPCDLRLARRGRSACEEAVTAGVDVLVANAGLPASGAARPS